MKAINSIISIVFITAMAYLSVTAFYTGTTARLPEPLPRRTEDRQFASTQSAPVQPAGSYDAIMKRNLFKTGTAPQKAAPTPEPEPDITQLQQTTLQLKLWGTVTSDKSGRAYAVIEEGRKRRQDLFRVGDTVENATIKQILREKVILTVNGKDEILSMEKSTGKRKQFLSSTSAPARPVAAPNPFPAAAQPSGEAGSSQVAIERATVNDAVNNINDLMKQAKIRPHFRNGKPDGLILSRVKSDSIFTQLGLRSGDIITGVNGTPIESVDDALNFYNSLKSASNVSLQIRRRGKDENIDYSIE